MIAIDTEKRGIDWSQVKADYISGSSYGVLSQKYKVSKSVIFKKSKKERWNEQREQTANEIRTRTAKKTAEAVSDNAVIFERMRKKALLKLERELDIVLSKNGTETRHTETWFSEGEKRTISETTISKLADVLAMMEKIAVNGAGTNEMQLKAIREILDGVPSAIN